MSQRIIIKPSRSLIRHAEVLFAMNTVSDTNILKGKQHIHFIGIGGSGMYPLVQILAAAGYHITGSDNNHTDTVDAERKLGITVTIGQKPENITGADLIVYTAAILSDNP